MKRRDDKKEGLGKEENKKERKEEGRKEEKGRRRKKAGKGRKEENQRDFLTALELQANIIIEENDPKKTFHNKIIIKKLK